MQNFSECGMTIPLDGSHEIFFNTGLDIVSIKSLIFRSKENRDKLLLKLFLQEKNSGSMYKVLSGLGIKNIKDLQNLNLEFIQKHNLKIADINLFGDSQTYLNYNNQFLKEHNTFSIINSTKNISSYVAISNIIRKNK